MEYRASHKYARMSARKARYVIDLVRGQSVNDALNTLKFTNRRAAPMIEKVLKSAMANAGDKNPEIDVNELVISEARVDEGPLSQGRVRFRIASRMGWVPIRKRTCHVELTLCLRSNVPARGKKKRRKLAAQGA